MNDEKDLKFDFLIGPDDVERILDVNSEGDFDDLMVSFWLVWRHGKDGVLIALDSEGRAEIEVGARFGRRENGDHESFIVQRVAKSGWKDQGYRLMVFAQMAGYGNGYAQGHCDGQGLKREPVASDWAPRAKETEGVADV